MAETLGEEACHLRLDGPADLDGQGRHHGDLGQCSFPSST